VEVVNKWHWSLERKLMCRELANCVALVSDFGEPDVDSITHSDCECRVDVVYIEVILVYYSYSESVSRFLRDRRLDSGSYVEYNLS